VIGGVGMDIVDLAMFQEQLDDKASSFVEGTFTQREIATAKARSKTRQARFFAARFAAKEALIKAWSTALWGQPPVLSHVDMREIEVCMDDFGRPGLVFHGAVAQAIETLGSIVCHLSLTHDGGYAAAVVVLEVRNI